MDLQALVIKIILYHSYCANKTAVYGNKHYISRRRLMLFL
jgi:hypothetical protein